ncbi:MAG: hemerythrin domain-containing protein [Flavobacteriales bacterium]|nr:hemerythrin domain-containing protein [Flavobacteriales bacterium]
MKIIDSATGKRVDGLGVKDVKRLKDVDPVYGKAEKEAEIEEFSPMDPPEAYDDKASVLAKKVPVSHSFLLELVEEHKELVEVIKNFEESLTEFHETHYNFTQNINNSFNKFFRFFDDHISPHNRKEERYLFPVLHNALLKAGEHGTGKNPQTAVDLMEDDHIKFIQLAALCFNLMGLGSRLPDSQSRAMTFDLAFHNGKELIEMLRLHIFREDNTLFPLAQKYLSEKDFGVILQQLK